MTKTSAPTFRKTKQGEWVAFGPAGTVRPGSVTVSKRDGSTKTAEVVDVAERINAPKWLADECIADLPAEVL